MTATRRSPRPSPRPQPREVDLEFAQLVEEWTREEPVTVGLDDESMIDDAEPDREPSKDESPSRVSVGVVGVLAFIFVFGALFGLAAFHSVLVQNQLRLDRLSRDVEREQARYQDLRIEYGQAAAPFRVLAQATARGMLPSKSKEPLQAVVSEQTDLHAPSGAHPFGNVSNYVPPVVSAPPTTAAVQTPPPQTTAATAAPVTTVTPPTTAPANTTPASTTPKSPTTSGAAR